MLFGACATVVPPDGGPKDTTPPVPLNYSPANKTKNFKAKKIAIKFDEFIQLKDLQNQLVVSPSMSENPDIYLKGKKLMIELPDSLEENTTYTIFLGNAVINYKEMLPVKNFQYVLSTGNQLDSLRIKGKVRNAYDLKTEEGILVMLYKNINDSAPYLQKPYYIAKTFGQGEFLLDNLSWGTYQIFVLKDLNSNYIYDQPTEEIAFLDSLIIPAPVKPADDSLNLITPVNLDLYLFKEKEKKQGLLGSKTVNPQLVQFEFRTSAERINFELLPENRTDWYFPVFSLEKDTVKLWITQELSDTIFVKISDDNLVYDTAQLVLTKPEKKLIGRQKRNERPAETDSVKDAAPIRIKINSNTGGGLDFFGSVVLNSSTPVKNFSKDDFQLLVLQDTTLHTIPFSLYFADSTIFDKIIMNADFEEARFYKIIVLDSAIYDLFGHTNDSLEFRFATSKKRNYGSLKLNVDYSDTIPLIIQLLNDKDNVIQSDILEDSVIYYPYLLPGNYKIKAVSDKNQNGIWDTGDYWKKIEPEKVFYLRKVLNIRANWDMEEKWILD